ncbi:MAG: HAD-IIB family hydrolase [Natronospirillum sp.]|uniref:HAD-IIB family hydrolase n=1 Tax=Natronospirillum sp. TaxID=2812955 RepID=UPI0025D904F9|nr:HAD-IIB family hydrolase [Natronospirillum sp.]MCH8550820.1 HAD-IIB family hydrolase [Natronospirillum sp.]
MTDTWRRIYTDMDGTLLDHHTYDWAPAAPLLQACARNDILVIPNTSKTADELEMWLDRLDLPGYGVAENGGMILLPESHDYWRSHEPEWEGARTLGFLMTRPYGAVCQWLSEVRTRHDFRFTGFHDVEVETVMAWTGLSEEEATLSMRRQCGEPLVWEGDDESYQKFAGLARADGWSVTRGGRFVHVGDDTSKATAMRWLESHLPEPGHAMALGDGENDRTMLENADSAAVIRNGKGEHLQLERADAYYTDAAGPKGWVEGVQHWLAREGIRLD